MRLLAAGAMGVLLAATAPAAHGALAQTSDTICSSPTITGSDLGEPIRGTEGSDVIYGGGGNDLIYGLGGVDVICGGPGGDIMYGDEQVDLLEGGPGVDRIDGGDGLDTVTYQFATKGITLDLAAGEARGAGRDTLVSVENGAGSFHDDRLSGTNLANTFEGLAGADELKGRGGSDVLGGGTGGDRLLGGGGSDSLTLLQTLEPVRIDLRSEVMRGEGLDVVTNMENARGSSGNDVLIGNKKRNRLEGAGGDDTVRGGPNGDLLGGGRGEDEVDGGRGNDVASGGLDLDVCVRAERTRQCESRA